MNTLSSRYATIIYLWYFLLLSVLSNLPETDFWIWQKSYTNENEEPSDSATCLTIYDKHGATQSCELQANAAPQVFQDLICKVCFEQ